MSDDPDVMLWTPLFETKEEAEEYAKQHNLRKLRLYQLVDGKWILIE